MSFLLLAQVAMGADQEFSIRLAHDSENERETREVLISTLEEFDVSKWTFTKNIVIDENVIPHSHPVLTLGARTRFDRLGVLADFLHEQSHWFEEKNLASVRKAVQQLQQIYPGLPTTPPEGANGRASTYLHLIVCYWELDAMTELVGETEARATVEATAKHHYRSVYRTVLDQSDKIRQVLVENGLLITGE